MEIELHMQCWKVTTKSIGWGNFFYTRKLKVTLGLECSPWKPCKWITSLGTLFFCSSFVLTRTMTRHNRHHTVTHCWMCTLTLRYYYLSLSILIAFVFHTVNISPLKGLCLEYNTCSVTISNNHTFTSLTAPTACQHVERWPQLAKLLMCLRT